MSEGIYIGKMIIAIAENNVDSLFSAFEEYQNYREEMGNSDFVSEYSQAIESVNKVFKLSSDLTAKVTLVNSFIDKLALDENEKQYLKLTFKLNHGDPTNQQREEIITELKMIAPPKYQREVDLLDLNIAVGNADVERIRVLLLKLQQ